VAAVLYSGLTRPRHWFMRLLGCKPLAMLGLFSYSLYLMHHPIEQILYYYRPAWASGEAGVFQYLTACLPVILLASWVFWWVFERPFLRRPALYQSPLVQVPTRLPRPVAVATSPSTPVRRRRLAPADLLDGAIEPADGESATRPIEVHPHP
jgi:peptidoglycan/LPS O-acetylase OafA/YrhL